jgi:hypothetical protein
MKRHSQQIKDKALELWKSGTKLEDIHKQLDIPIETLRTWHERYHWSEKRKTQKKKNEQELSKKIAKQNAKEKFDVRKEMIGNFRDAREIRQAEAEKPIEKASLLNVEHKYLEHIGKIDQLYTENVKLSGQVKVIPIFGSDIKANVPSHDSNQKDN